MTLRRPGRVGAGSRLGIRVSTDPRRGRGHLARCLAVRAHVPHPVSWFVDPGEPVSALPDGPDDRVFVEDDACSVGVLAAAARSGVLDHALVDSYAISVSEIAGLNRIVPTAAFADAPPYPDATLVIDSQPTAVAAPSRLAGPDYLAVEGAVLPWRGCGGLVAGPDSVARLLVAFGAVDSADRTGLVLEALAGHPALAARLTVTVVLGPQAPHLARVRDIVANLPGAGLIVGPENLGPIYATTTLAVGAPGVSQSERMLCGVPTVLVPQNQPQVHLAQAWADLGAAVTLPPEGAQIATRIAHLLDYPEQLSAMRTAGLRLIDGMGAVRVAQGMTALLTHGEEFP